MIANLAKGDEIFVTGEGKTLSGQVWMISPNQVAALIMFDGVIHGHIGMMAVQRHDKDLGIYRSIMDGTEITMRRKPAATTEEGNANGQTT